MTTWSPPEPSKISQKYTSVQQLLHTLHGPTARMSETCLSHRRLHIEIQRNTFFKPVTGKYLPNREKTCHFSMSHETLE